MLESSVTHRFYRHPELPGLELRYGQTSDACYALHTHAEYSLGAVISGQSCYQYRQKTYAIGAGDTMLIAPNVPHACNPATQGRWQYLMLYIERDAWHALCQRYDCDIVVSGAPKKAVNLLRLLMRLQRLWSASASVLVIESAWLDCFQYLCKVYGDKREHDPVQATSINTALDWLQEHLTDEVHLSDWAEQIGLPRHQLLRQFRRHVGMSPHQYLLNQRIQLAKHWLKSGNCATDIAYRLGFSDQSHFQRTFKRYTAVTPKGYQRSK